MCQQILQYCSGSTKPLLFVGGLLTFLLAIAIGYFGYDTNALYYSIDPQVADTRSLGFHLQLAAAVYLTLVTLFSCYAAYYDQKHSIRALSGVTTLNFVLALAAIFLIPSGDELSKPFQTTLEQAAIKYDYSDPVKSAGSSSPFPNLQVLSSTSAATGTTAPPSNNSVERQTRSTVNDNKPADISPANATKLWDSLQARGCCGITNGTIEWKDKIPKSCCATPVNDTNFSHCKEIDQAHQKGCLALIASTSLNLVIVLALIALVNFYLATISGINAYKTYSYSEASQNAYT